MIYLFYISFLVFIAVSITECQIQKDGEIDDILIKYQSSFEEVKIQGTKGEYVRVEYDYGDVPSGTPNSVIRHSQTFSLSQEEVKDLLAKLDQVGFWELDSMYGAPADQRYYPYRISIQLGKEFKEVIYRSNPSYDGLPQAFREAEKLIIQLAKSKTNTK